MGLNLFILFLKMYVFPLTFIVSLKSLAENKTGRYLTNHREYKPPEVSVDGEVDHLLDWVEVWIIQVPQEPQHTWPKHLHTETTHLKTFHTVLRVFSFSFDFT